MGILSEKGVAIGDAIGMLYRTKLNCGQGETAYIRDRTRREDSCRLIAVSRSLRPL